MRFVKSVCRKPPRNLLEEHNLRSWWKNTKKSLNSGELKDNRIEALKKLMELAEENKHVNQHQY